MRLRLFDAGGERRAKLRAQVAGLEERVLVLRLAARADVDHVLHEQRVVPFGLRLFDLRFELPAAVVPALPINDLGVLGLRPDRDDVRRAALVAVGLRHFGVVGQEDSVLGLRLLQVHADEVGLARAVVEGQIGVEALRLGALDPRLQVHVEPFAVLALFLDFLVPLVEGRFRRGGLARRGLRRGRRALDRRSRSRGLRLGEPHRDLLVGVGLGRHAVVVLGQLVLDRLRLDVERLLRLGRAEGLAPLIPGTGLGLGRAVGDLGHGSCAGACRARVDLLGRFERRALDVNAHRLERLAQLVVDRQAARRHDRTPFGVARDLGLP